MTMTNVSKTLRVGLLAAAVALSGATSSALAQGMDNMQGMDMQGGNMQGMGATPEAGGAPAMGNMPAQGQGMAAQGQGMAGMQGGMMPMMMGMMPMMMAAMPMGNMGGGAAAAPAAAAVADTSGLEQQVDELSQVIATLVERIDQLETETGADDTATTPRVNQ